MTAMLRVCANEKIGFPHTCCVCGKNSDWDKTWTWYGSYKDLDDGNDVDETCSDECREIYNKSHRIPHANRIVEEKP